MAIVVKDRVQETTGVTGTGPITLAGAVLGFQSFAAIGNGNTTYYAINDPTTGDWEVGIGTYSTTGPTLSRDTVLSSSNAGSLVSFSAGTKNVFCTYPSERAVYLDQPGSYPVQNTFDTLTVATATLTAGTISTTPSVGIDLVNKTYVDSVSASGIHYHDPVYVEVPNTTGNLNATYANGGTNTNIIQIANGSDITFFGYVPVVGDQFLTSTGNGLIANTQYWIVALVGSACQISLTYGGPIITGLTNGGVTLPSLVNPGVGATLTNAGTQAAFTADGIAVPINSRVLIYNQTSALENGVYTLTTVGSGSTNWVLTRATDANTYSPFSPNALGQGDAFYVTNGNTGAGETYLCNVVGSIFFGLTSITLTQISSAQVYSAGTGLNLSPATTFNISDTGVTATTYGSASQVPVFAVNAQGQLTSVTNTSIAIAAGAVSGLAASATTDTTNASNISSGTLGTSRLSGSYTGITGVGTLTAGTWNGSTIAAAYGGTGQSSYAVGDLLYADTTTSLAKLADVAVGNALISGGVSSAPSWGKIGLATHVSGTLPIANGGTGSNATTFVNLATNVTGTLPVANGGTGSSSTTLTANYFFASPNGSTGSPSFRAIVAADIPTLNQNTTGSAATLTTPRAIYGNNFDGSAALTQIIASTYGGTGNGFTKFTGPTTAEKTFTLPDATATILTSNAAVTVAQGGTGQTSYTDGQLLIGNSTGSTLTKTTLTAGTAVSVTNGAGSITIANTGVTSAVAGTGVTVSGATGAVTVSIGQAVATSSNVQFNSLGVGTAGSGTAGEIRATNNVTAYYSDDRLKTKLGYISDALEKVKTLSGFYYEANQTAQDLGYRPVREVGVSAQQVQAVLPEVVVPAPIDDKYLTVRYEKLIPLLIEAIKELDGKLEQLIKDKS